MYNDYCQCETCKSEKRLFGNRIICPGFPTVVHSQDAQHISGEPVLCTADLKWPRFQMPFATTKPSGCDRQLFPLETPVDMFQCVEVSVWDRMSCPSWCCWACLHYVTKIHQSLSGSVVCAGKQGRCS